MQDSGFPDRRVRIRMATRRRDAVMVATEGLGVEEAQATARGHGKVPTDGHEEVPTLDLIHEAARLAVITGLRHARSVTLEG